MDPRRSGHTPRRNHVQNSQYLPSNSNPIWTPWQLCHRSKHCRLQKGCRRDACTRRALESPPQSRMLLDNPLLLQVKQTVRNIPFHRFYPVQKSTQHKGVGTMKKKKRSLSTSVKVKTNVKAGKTTGTTR